MFAALASKKYKLPNYNIVDKFLLSSSYFTDSEVKKSNDENKYRRDKAHLLSYIWFEKESVIKPLWKYQGPTGSARWAQKTAQ